MGRKKLKTFKFNANLPADLVPEMDKAIEESKGDIQTRTQLVIKAINLWLDMHFRKNGK